MLTCQKDKFSLPADVSYLNTAYMSPLLKTVENAGVAAVRRKGVPFEVTADDFFSPVETVKSQFAQLIDCHDKDRIAIIPSASYGLANAANNIPLSAESNIVLVEDQFPSNVYVWQRKAAEAGATVHIISSPDTSHQKGTAWTEKILDAINENTAVVSLPHVHWSEGIVFDLKAIREKSSKHHAFMVIDGTQSVGAMPFSVEEFQPDALICAAYKWLMGPYSFGFAYYGPAFDNGVPIEDNWINRLNSDDFAGLVNYQPQYQEKAARFNVGECSNFIMIPMMNKALQQILEWTPTSIQSYCKSISDKVVDEIRSVGFEVSEDGQRSHHLFGIKIPARIQPEMLKQVFAEQKMYVSFRGNYIRVSPHLFNEQEDFEKLAHCLKLVRA